MAAGVFSWSLMTVLCGAASTYWQLFLARMGVGVGEATLGPAANSTLADYFDQARLPLAIAVVAASPFIGQGLANMLGGPLITYLESTPNISVPVLGELFSWQVVFIVVGLPGAIVTIWVMTIKEPARRGRSADGKGNVPFSEVWAFVKTRGMFFFLIFTAYLCLSIQGWSLFSWIVEYYVRNHEWSRADIGVRYGAIAMFVGITGSIWAGWMASRLIRRNVPDATVRIVFYGTILLCPLAVVMTLLPDPWIALGVLAPVTFLMAMPSGLIMTTIQLITPNELRGQMIAFYLIAVNFIAYTVAPSLPAVLGDYMFESELALGKSISLLAAVNYSIAAVCLGLCLKYFRRALEAAMAWSGKPASA
jgi:MFS family permease